jgi:hypothetical protein
VSVGHVSAHRPVGVAIAAWATLHRATKLGTALHRATLDRTALHWATLHWAIGLLHVWALVPGTIVTGGRAESNAATKDAGKEGRASSGNTNNRSGAEATLRDIRDGRGCPSFGRESCGFRGEGLCRRGVNICRR